MKTYNHGSLALFNYELLLLGINFKYSTVSLHLLNHNLITLYLLQMDGAFLPIEQDHMGNGHIPTSYVYPYTRHRVYSIDKKKLWMSYENNPETGIWNKE